MTDATTNDPAPEVKEPLLTLPQRRRVALVHKARRVLQATGFASASGVAVDEVVRLAEWLEGTEEWAANLPAPIVFDGCTFTGTHRITGEGGVEPVNPPLRDDDPVPDDDGTGEPTIAVAVPVDDGPPYPISDESDDPSYDDPAKDRTS